ncbi:MAG: DMT family transporter [Lachnospiraceae bacterium]|nr:DMT family transporter [Lachnospiraceae bacterium]
MENKNIQNKIEEKETDKNRIDNRKQSNKIKFTNGHVQGIFFILGAAFFFSLMTFFVRISGDLPTMQKCFFRNFVAAIVSGYMVLHSKEKLRVLPDSWKYLVIRATAGGLGMICNFYAIDHLDISDANMLNKLSPFFAIIFSIFVLKEKVNKYEWVAVIVAFIGALFVVKPSFDLACMPAVVGLLGGLGAGIAYTFVRKLGKQGERGIIIVLFFSTFTCLLTLPFMLFDFHPMTVAQWTSLLMAGAAATGGQLCITAAYTKAPAKEISIFDYSQVIFAAILGMLFLDQLPDVYSMIGYVIIIGSAIAKWCYNLKQSAETEEE